MNDKEKIKAIKILFEDLRLDRYAEERMYELIKQCRKILELNPKS